MAVYRALGQQYLVSLQPLRTLTATIAGEMGETVGGSEHYYALFAVGLVLFVITFIINFVADFPTCIRSCYGNSHDDSSRTKLS